MTKFLMTAAALILLSVSAHAGFKAPPNYHPPDSVQLVCVPPLLPPLLKELDPVVRIHVGASFENEKVETFSVVHETYLVKKYDAQTNTPTPNWLPRTASLNGIGREPKSEISMFQ
jgi:hypothetical protein